jgi:hypothetical protein
MRNEMMVCVQECITQGVSHRFVFCSNLTVLMDVGSLMSLLLLHHTRICRGITDHTFVD